MGEGLGFYLGGSMGAAKRVQIGDRLFPSKRKAIEECQRIYKKYPGAHRVLVPVTDKDDEAFLRDLLTYHREASAKMSKDIASFSVGYNDYQTRSFYIIYEDGSDDDFTFYDCVDGATLE